MNPNRIVLVEPGAHLDYGHHKEKLILWVNSFLQSGWQVTVVCSKKPDPYFLPMVSWLPFDQESQPIFPRLCNRRQTFWLIFQTYLRAFRYAKIHRASMLGLTTSTLVPVFAAFYFARKPAVRFGQIMMYSGHIGQRSGDIRKIIEAVSLNFLLHSGVYLFPNSSETHVQLSRLVKSPKQRSQIITIRDPIFRGSKSLNLKQKKSSETLLVVGLDDSRRSPIFHLSHAKLLQPPKQVWIHAPAKDQSEFPIRFGWSNLCTIRPLTDYLLGEDLSNLYAEATWCFFAYRPISSQGSGLLAQSIAEGTPVLCSRFPFAEELFSEFGSLGELFTLNDLSDFNRAWTRLRNWTEKDWLAFNLASQRFAESVEATRITQRVVDYFQSTDKN
jgi:hypothetical protein